jgi:hypothetical protein
VKDASGEADGRSFMESLFGGGVSENFSTEKALHHRQEDDLLRQKEY